MASGVAVSDECKTCYEQLKLKKSFPWVIYRLSEDMKKIEVDCCGEPGSTYEDLLTKLREAEGNQQGRYCVYDCHFDKSDSKKSKIIFMMWNHDSLPVKQKMIMASSKDALRKLFQGINLEVQATDYCDIDENTLNKLCEEKDKI